MANYDQSGEVFAYRYAYPKNQGNLTVTRNEAYSYDECIAKWTDDGPILNTEKYSVTTSAHQGAIRRAIEARGFSPDPVQPDDLEDGWVLYTCRPI